MTRRRLPHFYPERAWLFVTWHLHGSLPVDMYPPPGLRGGVAFVWMDRYLDTALHGPQWLRRPELADVVVGVLRRAEADVGAFAVMSNHVHVLLRARGPVSGVLQWIKGVSAREANRVLGRTGEAFWQRESYDHVVRSDAEHERIVGYIEANPVRAGLVAAAGDYRWSSAWRGE